MIINVITRDLNVVINVVIIWTRLQGPIVKMNHPQAEMHHRQSHPSLSPRGRK
jgi:hypothetical protein